jgi:transposase
LVSKRKRYTREFKIETVRLLTGSDHSVTEVARDLGIHPKTLYKWIHQYFENPKEAYPGKRNNTLVARHRCSGSLLKLKLTFKLPIIKKSKNKLTRSQQFDRPYICIYDAV